ncbi:MAG TPA: hypothetical protein VLH13_04545 [Methanomassiliicoccales archaeon]|nr:hypothetical protein [Methanomassiliicoccales archaeon]
MNTTRVEHFIYGPVPKKGYSKRARSSNISPDAYERFTGYYIPIDPAYVSADDLFNSEARLVASTPSVDGVYFSKIFRRSKLDEKGRSGILTHTLLVPRRALLDGLSYYDIEKAIADHEANHGIPIGDMAPMEIEWETKTLDQEMEGIRTLISKETLNRLVDGYAKDPRVKFVITCRGTDQKDRIRLGYMLSKFLDINLGLVPIAFLSEPPLMLADTQCNLVLTKIPLTIPQKGWRAVSSLVDASPGSVASSSQRAKDIIDKVYS